MAMNRDETGRIVPAGPVAGGAGHSAPLSDPERRSLSGSDVRRAAMTAVIELLLHTGYHGITMEAVARTAGISKSTLYRHWPDKAHLVLDAYTHRTNVDTAVPDTGDVRVDLGAYLSKLAYGLNFRGAAPIVSEIILEANRNDEFALLFRSTLLRDRRRAFLTIFLRAQRRGQIRGDVDLGTVIDAAYGAVHHRLMVSGQTIDGDFAANLNRVILGGILVDAS